MKLRELLLAITVGLLVSWWLWLRPQPESKVAESEIPKINQAVRPKADSSMKVAEPKKTQVAPPAAPAAVVNHVKAPDQLQATKPQPPPPGHLDFEVREGVAIAQGDMVLGKVVDENKSGKGIAKANRTRLWDSADIPYSIQDGVTNREAIQAAIAQFHTNTSVRFVPYTGQKDSIVFVKADELCASYLGRVGGAQPIFLSPKCGAYEVQHELMHALGFVHEQSRPDRDKYVEVLWANIDEKYWPQFWVIPDEMIHEYVGSVFSFDPQSMMLYDTTAFAKEVGSLSMKSKSTQDLQPTRSGFSRTDKERIFYLYSR